MSRATRCNTNPKIGKAYPMRPTLAPFQTLRIVQVLAGKLYFFPRKRMYQLMGIRGNRQYEWIPLQFDSADTTASLRGTSLSLGALRWASSDISVLSSHRVIGHEATLFAKTFGSPFRIHPPPPKLWRRGFL
jgi:hypothetical protein